LNSEWLWSSYLCLNAILLPTPKFESQNYARNILNLLQNNNYNQQQIWMKIPLINFENNLESNNNIQSLIRTVNVDIENHIKKTEELKMIIPSLVKSGPSCTNI
jgi:hypothetical protein